MINHALLTLSQVIKKPGVLYMFRVRRLFNDDKEEGEAKQIGWLTGKRANMLCDD